MAIQKSEAFVLKTQPFRTSSLIVTAFSKEFGKIKGIAKGVRREGMPRPSTFEPFTLIEIVYYEKLHSELHLISETAILETFERLRSDLEGLATAYYWVELVDHLAQPQDPHLAVFELLRFGLEHLSSATSDLLNCFFELRLFQEMGFLPSWENCQQCGARELERTYFSPRGGGILCSRCRGRVADSYSLAKATLDTIRFFTGVRIPLHRADWDKSFAGQDNTKVRAELRRLTDSLLRERIGRRFPTRKFLHQVQALLARPKLIHKAQNH